ncbi:probable serine/threonine-protein kinase nek3 [Uranotaenia lowii]|uniref:probable serine/threonine-protein kinase nek3 n=1 Tax=Uranotaenia lowii TaxID=190385 RepID=UPI0024790F03|nr:probable serine/threonine-protein kinase nek3 [Uranotaenia lowii]
MSIEDEIRSMYEISPMKTRCTTGNSCGTVTKSKYPINIHTVYGPDTTVDNVVKRMCTDSNTWHAISDGIPRNMTDLPVIEASDAVVPIDVYHPPLEFISSFLSLVAFVEAFDPSARDFRRADFDLMNLVLSQVDWTNLQRCTSVHVAVNLFYTIMDDVFDESVPMARPPLRPPWTNSRLKRLKQLRSKLLRTFTNARCPFIKMKLNDATKQYRIYNRLCYRRYVNRTQSELRLNPKKFWNFENNKRKESGLPAKVHLDDRIAKSHAEKHFSSAVCKLCFCSDCYFVSVRYESSQQQRAIPNGRRRCPATTPGALTRGEECHTDVRERRRESKEAALAVRKNTRTKPEEFSLPASRPILSIQSAVSTEERPFFWHELLRYLLCAVPALRLPDWSPPPSPLADPPRILFAYELCIDLDGISFVMLCVVYRGITLETCYLVHNVARSADQLDDVTSKATTGRSTPRLQPPKKDTYGAPYRSNRFGFRSTNVVRPASAGLQPKTLTDCDKQLHSINNNNNNNNNNHTTNNNNNNVYITTDKRRSKSASAAASARTTFAPLYQPPVHERSSAALQHLHHGPQASLHRPQPKYHTATTTKIAPSSEQPPTAAAQQQQIGPASSSSASASSSTAAVSGSIDENRQHSGVNNANDQRQQFGSAVDSGQPRPTTNKIGTKGAVPCGQESSSVVAKFTLHSGSLPKPQYPVPISLSTITGGPIPTARFAMDPKGAKHAVNVSRKGTLQSSQYQRDVSSDRALDLQDEDLNSNVDNSPNIRMPRQRYRNLEMVMAGRHKFEVRDLETLTAEPIVSLALPQLPSAFTNSGQQPQPVPLSGLVRSSELPRQLDDDIDINDNRYEQEAVDPIEIARKDSITSSDVESLEEEKLTRDNNSSEKSLKGALIKDMTESHCSKTSSPGSSRASWCNAGETMAPKECSSLSLSSSDESNAKIANNRKMLEEEEDISSVTITAGNPSLLSSFSAIIPMDISMNVDSISEVQNSFNDNTISEQPNDEDQMFRSEETKFAEMAAAVSDAILLDDETSPTDSLVSSCTESDDARKNRKKAVERQNEKDKEKDIDEISPELEELTSPTTPGTPTHASNSLSLSDGGRDFLIDDEIADQPALVFDEPALNDSSIIDVGSIHLNLTEDTPTLRDSVSSLNNNNNRSRSGPAPVPKPRKIMAETYESPAPVRKNRNRLPRSESLDTLSPCDSIASDDFMLDFNSSMDSIDRMARSNASGSTSALHSMDELQLFAELENKGGQLMHEWSKLLRTTTQQQQKAGSIHSTSRESIT